MVFGQFLDSLLNFDRDNVDEPLVAYCEAKFSGGGPDNHKPHPDFNYETIVTKSGAGEL
eukprot:SAG22_NODE_38_length_26325_cov_107.302067_33_plen_59_part_00